MKILFLTLLFTLLMTGKVYAEQPVAGISVTLDRVKDLDHIYTTDETTVLYKIVEAEVTGGTIESKKNVASVILNRVTDDNFPNTISEVVFQKNQFSPVSDKRYWEVEVTDGTIQAVDEVLLDGVTTEALYFVNLDKTSKKMRKWFKSLEYLFSDEANHSFYK